MIEKPTDDTPTDGARCWLLEVNSFPASAPFDQWHGKSQRFHEGVVGFATSLLHLMRGAPVPAAQAEDEDAPPLASQQRQLDGQQPWRRVA